MNDTITDAQRRAALNELAGNLLLSGKLDAIIRATKFFLENGSPLDDGESETVRDFQVTYKHADDAYQWARSMKRRALEDALEDAMKLAISHGVPCVFDDQAVKDLMVQRDALIANGG